ncbi:MAG: helix-turn-helix domain-containing protein [Candidatus Dadabacteria bacterium]|nr:helix-turn-helix domain-containing protein [Candidatus Dadabacteria bacterium]
MRGKLLTPSQITEIYGIPRSHLYSWFKRRCISHVKPSKKSVFVYENDLREFLAKREVKPVRRQRKKGLEAQG